MNVTQSSKWLFLAAAGYAIACAPLILLAERLGWPESPFHVTQLLAVAVCFPASLLFLRRSRGAVFSTLHWLAVAAAVLSGLWLAFLGVVLFAYAFVGMD